MPALSGTKAQSAASGVLIPILGDADSSWHRGKTTRRTGNYLKLNDDFALDRCTVARLEETASLRVGILRLASKERARQWRPPNTAPSRSIPIRSVLAISQSFHIAGRSPFSSLPCPIIPSRRERPRSVRKTAPGPAEECASRRYRYQCSGDGPALRRL